MEQHDIRLFFYRDLQASTTAYICIMISFARSSLNTFWAIRACEHHLSGSIERIKMGDEFKDNHEFECRLKPEDRIDDCENEQASDGMEECIGMIWSE